MYIPKSQTAAVSLTAIVTYIALTFLVASKITLPFQINLEDPINLTLLGISLALAVALKAGCINFATKDIYSPNLIRFHKVSMLIAIPVVYGLIVLYWYQVWFLKTFLPSQQAILLATIVAGYCFVSFLIVEGALRLAFKPSNFNHSKRNLLR